MKIDICFLKMYIKLEARPRLHGVTVALRLSIFNKIATFRIRRRVEYTTAVNHYRLERNVQVVKKTQIRCTQKNKTWQFC